MKSLFTLRYMTISNPCVACSFWLSKRKRNCTWSHDPVGKLMHCNILWACHLQGHVVYGSGWSQNIGRAMSQRKGLCETITRSGGQRCEDLISALQQVSRHLQRPKNVLMCRKGGTRPCTAHRLPFPMHKQLINSSTVRVVQQVSVPQFSRRQQKVPQFSKTPT